LGTGPFGGRHGKREQYNKKKRGFRDRMGSMRDDVGAEESEAKGAMGQFRYLRGKGMSDTGKSSGDVLEQKIQEITSKRC